MMLRSNTNGLMNSLDEGATYMYARRRAGSIRGAGNPPSPLRMVAPDITYMPLFG